MTYDDLVGTDAKTEEQELTPAIVFKLSGRQFDLSASELLVNRAADRVERALERNVRPIMRNQAESG